MAYGNEHVKHTTLSIAFIEGVDSKDGMTSVMEILGAPDHKIESIVTSWNLCCGDLKETDELKKYRVSDKQLVEFLRANISDNNFSIDGIMASTYNFGSYENKSHIQDKIFKNAPGKANTRIQWLMADSIDIETEGRDVTRTRIENLHRFNVLSLKDKIVAHKLVQRVEYTCRWKTTKREDCLV